MAPLEGHGDSAAGGPLARQRERRRGGRRALRRRRRPGRAARRCGCAAAWLDARRKGWVEPTAHGCRGALLGGRGVGAEAELLRHKGRAELRPHDRVRSARARRRLLHDVGRGLASARAGRERRRVAELGWRRGLVVVGAHGRVPVGWVGGLRADQADVTGALVRSRDRRAHRGARRGARGRQTGGGRVEGLTRRRLGCAHPGRHRGRRVDGWRRSRRWWAARDRRRGRGREPPCERIERADRHHGGA
mmetsp:Transcript_6057/g.15514  ORF Transcript_6057/g.15514 Transcript_6057/m.15514 type:complete len:248 (+) Transcript_6057:654-1397(+)